MSESTSIVHDENGNAADELKSLLREAEAALSKLGDQAGDEVVNLRDRLRSALADSKSTLAQAAEYARKQLARTDEFVRTNPYSSIGVATGAGLCIGYLLARQCGDRS